MKTKYQISLFILILFISPRLFAQSAGELSVDFLDVGQADCTVITDANYCIIIDTGNANDRNQITSFLNKKGISKVNLLLLTHPHIDHIGSAVPLIENFKVEKIFMSSIPSDTNAYNNLIDTIKKKNITIHSPVSNEIMELGKIRFTFFFPKSIDYDEQNNNSIVTKLTYGKVNVIFMGDAEIPEEYDLLDQKIDLRADIIKIGHHGSRYSSSDYLIEAVMPQWAIFTTGKESPKNPSKTILNLMDEKGIKYLRTDKNGQIRIMTDGEKYSFFVEVK